MVRAGRTGIAPLHAPRPDEQSDRPMDAATRQRMLFVSVAQFGGGFCWDGTAVDGASAPPAGGGTDGARFSSVPHLVGDDEPGGCFQTTCGIAGCIGCGRGAVDGRRLSAWLRGGGGGARSSGGAERRGSGSADGGRGRLGERRAPSAVPRCAWDPVRRREWGQAGTGASVSTAILGNPVGGVIPRCQGTPGTSRGRRDRWRIDGVVGYRLVALNGLGRSLRLARLPGRLSGATARDADLRCAGAAAAGPVSLARTRRPSAWGRDTGGFHKHMTDAARGGCHLPPGYVPQLADAALPVFSDGRSRRLPFGRISWAVEADDFLAADHDIDAGGALGEPAYARRARCSSLRLGLVQRASCLPGRSGLRVGWAAPARARVRHGWPVPTTRVRAEQAGSGPDEHQPRGPGSATRRITS